MDTAQPTHNMGGTEKEVDIYRDTLLRYMGYANEVGESFRPLIHVRYVYLSYALASAYVLADATSKAQATHRASASTKATSLMFADVLAWQGLASVAIPGFTINRIVYYSKKFLKKSKITKDPLKVKWTPTLTGLACIPLIIHPIDNFVTFLLNNTLRPALGIPKQD